MLNTIINGGFSAKAEKPKVKPPSTLFKLLVHNHRGEPVNWWWVNYSGEPVLYAVISPGKIIRQLAFGTHPWLVTDANGQVISSVIPYKSNMQLTIE